MIDIRRMSDNRQIRLKNSVVAEAMISVLIFAATCRLFYFQIVSPKLFPSDTPKHIKFAEQGRGYSSLMPVIGAVMRLTSPYEDIAVAAL